MDTRKSSPQNGLSLSRNNKSIFSMFNFISKREEPPKQKEVKRRKRRMPEALKAYDLCTDMNGNLVNCRLNSENRMITEKGEFFSGTVKKMSGSELTAEIKYKNGYKIEEKRGSSKKVYTENGTKFINQYNETISEININDSVINKECKSIVYYDEEIKFARLDFNTGDEPGFAGLEIREDGMVGGISQSGGNWHIYFSISGQDAAYSESDTARLYQQIKNILKSCRENHLLLENNPIDEVEEQIEGICSRIRKK